MIKVIGLTGPIGSGKDTVARVLRRRGVLVIDADQIGHALLAPQGEAWRGVVREFGVKVLKSGGDINRSKLAEMVFKDPCRVGKLNRILHPPMVKEIARLIDQAKAEGREFMAVNAALLEKMGLIPFVDAVWVVMAPVAVRMKRLLKKGFGKKEISARMRSQPKASVYRRIADVMIKNDGTLEQLRKQVLKYLEV